MSMSGVVDDPDWGCGFSELEALAVDNIRAFLVSVSDIGKIADELTKAVVDTSWMTHLDKGARRPYEKTVAETAKLLVQIFKTAAANPFNAIQEEFGELMVSMGAARALGKVLSHYEVPLAELWKPQVKQNEGFDFHTVCPQQLVNFGEAKYSAKKSPHGAAITQIAAFLTAEKHFRDRPHLEKLVHANAIKNLDDEKFGVIAAFSINANKPETVINNAIKSAKSLGKDHAIEQIYLIGVSHDA